MTTPAPIVPRDARSGRGGRAVSYLVVVPEGTDPAELPRYVAQAQTARVNATPEPPPQVLGGHGVEIDRDRHTVHVDGAELDLTYLEFELLAHLAAHPHRVHSRERLVTSVWGYGQHVGDGRTVDVHIARLRRKLGPGHRSRIVTVRRVGYKFAP